MYATHATVSPTATRRECPPGQRACGWTSLTTGLIARIGALRNRPAFVLHTGDVSHLSRPDEYDTLDQILKGARFDQTFCVPGEHDTFVDNGKACLDRFGQNTTGNGWRDAA